jgi:DNA-binding LacI/PurR family transcriptional regulator
VPIVVGGRPQGAGVPYFDVDNRSGAGNAVEHLVGEGRRTIATIAGPQDMAPGVDRLAGYRDVVGETADPMLVAYGDFSEASGERAMAELLQAHPSLDAVYVAADLMAAGSLRALRRAGRRIPDDVAVVGFDDLDLAQHTDPPLTTVRQPTVGMGQEMAKLLLALADGPAQSPVLLPTELIIRDSA